MNILKMFLVRIDNNPGAWKSGSEPQVIVIATDKNEAIEKVKNGWGEGGHFDKKTDDYFYSYGFGEGHNYIGNNAHLSAVEITFKDEDFKVISLREEKLKRITKDENEN